MKSSVWAMSAWKPTRLRAVRPLRAARPSCRQQCMPPQQISPSAASRSPCSSAMSRGLAERLGDSLRVASGSAAQSPGSRPSRSARRRTCRTPSSRSVRAMRHAFWTCVRNFLRASSLAHGRPAAGRRPDRGDNRADASPRDADLVGQRLQLVVGRVDADVRVEEEQVDAVELDAIDLGRGREVEHRIEAIGGSGRGLCRRGRATWHYEVQGICGHVSVLARPSLVSSRSVVTRSARWSTVERRCTRIGRAYCRAQYNLRDSGGKPPPSGGATFRSDKRGRGVAARKVQAASRCPDLCRPGRSPTRLRRSSSTVRNTRTPGSRSCDRTRKA